MEISLDGNSKTQVEGASSDKEAKHELEMRNEEYQCSQENIERKNEKMMEILELSKMQQKG